jgi:AraC-like DNA-binding protein
MDPLSDVLAMLRVESMLSSRFDGQGDWTFRFPEYAAQIKFGCVLAGRMYLQVAGAKRAWTSLDEGDFYLLTNGRPFQSSSAPKAPVLDGRDAYRAHRGADGVVRYGNEGPLVSLVSGRFEFSGDAGELLLRHLPALIHVRSAEPGTAALGSLLELLRTESGDPRLGSTVAEASLANLVLVQILRAFLANSPQPEGWLGAMRDARIGASLSAMHADLAQPWSVQSLANVAGMSRTAFAVRFKDLVDMTPLEYLSAWRMRVARRVLVESDERLARVAERVGYMSETAFSAAFKRDTGQSPGRFRASQARASSIPQLTAKSKSLLSGS